MIPMDVSVELVELANTVAKEQQIDARLLKAIITVESSWKPTAMRFEPDFKYIYRSAHFAEMNNITEISEITLQKFSFGVGQLMGGSARELGYSGPLMKLCDPAVGMVWAALKLKSYVRKYANRNDQIAAYNAGTPVFKNGKYANQDYVDKVNKELCGDINAL